MEPPIQYAKTSDGVRIAYWMLGNGPPIVRLGLYPGAAPSHMYTSLPEYRDLLNELSRALKLILIDFRGTGHSQRDVSDFSVESLVLDLESVVDRLGLDTFALYANTWSAPPSFAYMAKHPDRVSHLVLWHGQAKGPDLAAPLARAVASMVETDWDAASETVAHFQWGLSTGTDAHKYAAALRASVSQETFQAQWNAASMFDATSLLPSIVAPVLLFHRRDSITVNVDDARDLAAKLPDARLVLLERASMAASSETTSMVEEFLGIRPDISLPISPGQGPIATPSGTAVILFADIVDSTGLTERLGDAKFRGKARELDTAMRGIILDHSGTAIEGKLLGDGVLAVFTSARQAIEAALACGKAGADGGLPLHLGIHAGDVIREDNNVYGGAVNIAARISALSAPGEVLVSDTLRGLARTSADVTFENRGEQALKGIDEPVRVFAVRPT